MQWDHIQLLTMAIKPFQRLAHKPNFKSLIQKDSVHQVKGKSAFNFFNAEDLPWTTMAMRHSKFVVARAAIITLAVAMIESNSVFASSKGEGSTVYRLLTQTGQYICLQVVFLFGLPLLHFEERKQVIKMNTELKVGTTFSDERLSRVQQNDKQD